MIKPLNAVQNNGCDIFLVHSALGLLLIALVTVLLRYSLLCHVAFF